MSVDFTVILDNWYKRIAAYFDGYHLVLGLGWVVISNFIIRGVADRRLALPREWLLAAAERFPNSARINFQLADAEISEATVLRSLTPRLKAMRCELLICRPGIIRRAACSPRRRN